MPSKSRSRGYQRVIRAVATEPWAILPEKFEAICEMLELRANGARFTPDEIRARIGEPEARPETKLRVSNSVALIGLQGVIAPRTTWMTQISGATSLQKFCNQLRAADEDPTIETIVLDVDSPGGQAVMNAETAAFVRAVRARKRIIAVATGTMASAAYYIASAASEVVASPSAWVGSIGTLVMHTETSKSDEKIGIKRTIVFAGKHKADANATEPLSKQSRETLQDRVDGYYAMFLEDVAANRGVSVAKVERDYGQGKVLLAKDALKAGMVDRVATLEEVLEELGATFDVDAPEDDDDWTASANANALKMMETIAMTKELKAALVAAGLVNADASDAEALLAMNVFCKARGVDVPATPAALSKLLASKPKAESEDPDADEDEPDQEGDDADPDQEGDDEEPEQEDDEDEPKSLGKPSAGKLKSESKATLRERVRAKEIRSMGALLKRQGITQADVDKAIENGMTRVEANDYFLKKIAKKNPPMKGHIKSLGSERDTISNAIESVLTDKSLLAIGRTRQQLPQLPQAARDLQYKPLMALAELSLRSMGVRIDGMAPAQVAKLALSADSPAVLLAADAGSYNTTGSLPNIMANVQGKVLEVAWQNAPTTYQLWCTRQESVPDFKPKTLLQVSGFGKLGQVPEGDDYKQSKLSENAEPFKVEKYGDLFGMTVEMMLNDDTRALNRVPAEKTIAAARTLNDLCYETFLANPTMGDGVTLFHEATHKNVVPNGSGGKPSVAQLTKMRKLLRLMKGLEGSNPLNLPLGYLLVPAELETIAEQAVWSPGDHAAPDGNPAIVNPFQNKAMVIADPMLDGSSSTIWYGVANNLVMETVGYFFLTGEETPQLESWWDPKNDTRFIKIKQSFGAFAANWRSIVQNIGA